MSNRLTPDQISSIVSDVVKTSNWAKKEVDSLLAKLNAMDERVSQRATSELLNGQKLLTPTDSAFGIVQKMVLDDLTNHKLGYDEIMFAFSYDVAKRIVGRVL